MVAAGISLSRFTNAITKAVNSSPELFGAWVMAELSDVRVAGGHCYLELIEKNEAGQTVAKMRATIWQTVFNQLRRKFFLATQRDIATGLKVLVKGNASHHSLYGLSFNITDIDPSYTLGDIERLRKEILLRLTKEGIIDANRNKIFPAAPQRIAVISAEGAAGLGDFMKQLLINSEHFAFYPKLFPCMMQGDRVSASIRMALKAIQENSSQWDCVAIVRGGGATTDLNGFDDYELAKAVATCSLPVVVGIGHERDRNVLDEVACVSLKTPTAVAVFFIDRLREAYETVLRAADRLREIAADKMIGEERRLASLQSLLPQLILRRLSVQESKLKAIWERLPILVEGRIGKEKVTLSGTKDMVRMLSASTIGRSMQNLENIENLMKVLDPSNTLRRGYSVTRVNGKAVKDASSLKEGDILNTTLFQGEIRSKIF